MLRIIVSTAMIGIAIIIVAQGGIAHFLLKRLQNRRQAHDLPPGEASSPQRSVDLANRLAGLGALLWIGGAEVLLHLANAIPNLRESQRVNLPYFGALMLLSALSWLATLAAGSRLLRSLTRPADGAENLLRGAGDWRVVAALLLVLSTLLSMSGLIALGVTFYQLWSD